MQARSRDSFSLPLLPAFEGTAGKQDSLGRIRYLIRRFYQGTGFPDLTANESWSHEFPFMVREVQFVRSLFQAGGNRPLLPRFSWEAHRPSFIESPLSEGGGFFPEGFS